MANQIYMYQIMAADQDELDDDYDAAKAKDMGSMVPRFQTAQKSPVKYQASMLKQDVFDAKDKPNHSSVQKTNTQSLTKEPSKL